MNLTVMLITNGRSTCLLRTVASVLEMWRGEGPSRVLIVDDSGDPAYRQWLLSDAVSGVIRSARWPVPDVVSHQQQRGFAAAIDTGWGEVAGDWVFHLEDDFVFTRPISPEDMVKVLEPRPLLAQMSLMRQPCNDVEAAAGGLVALHRNSFTERTYEGFAWMEQRLYFTTNPSVYSTGLITTFRWPQVPESEGHFTRQLLQEGYTLGVWGSRDDGPWVHHIGERTGTGY